MAPKSKSKRTADDMLTTLEKKYPRVDSSLIAALLSEIDPSQPDMLVDLHSTLYALNSPADDVPSLSSALEKASLTSSSSVSDPLESLSSPATTSASSSSLASFSTPLGFLQNLFPHLPSSKLQSSLDQHGADNLDQIVESLLSDDYIRELQEADIDRSESVVEWTAITKKSSPSSSPAPTRQKFKSKKQTTLVIGDVRHRHRAPPRSSAPSAPSVDPWTYVDSLATRLNAILPNVSATVFSSAFHNPVHPTPAAALRATLASLGHTNTVDDFALTALLSLLDADADDIPDASLCLRATASEPNDAYHLVEILREIDERLPVIIHSPSSPLQSSKRVPAAPPDTPPIPQVRRFTVAEPPALPPAAPPKSAWGTIPVKVKSTTYSHSAFIPGSSGWTVQPGEERSGVNEDDATACLDEAEYWKEKRRAVGVVLLIFCHSGVKGMKLVKALRQASELFTRQKHEHGREGALYYSQLAHGYATREREWKMKAAKAGVKARQERSPHKAIDLHGLTVNQSLEIVREGVNAWWSSAGAGATPSSPLQIITGQGRHSKGNVPVIAPAVMKLLEKEGWRAHKREGIVYVTGVTTARRG
ncbi:hypothetical protein FRC12_006702 [Ceratobasidium sp. 428]|nr:hypothetical protein FRC12_006702 [Ceratobasidium sp. 428]